MAAQEPTKLIAKLLQHDRALVQTDLLHPDCVSTFTPAATHLAPQGIVLLLHGFTAGPWQFKDICQNLQAAGLHSFAARLPGHGARARVQNGPHAFSSKELPKSFETRKFKECAEVAMAAVQEFAHAHGLPVMLVGFSAGGALASDLLLRADANIHRAVLVAPLLRPLGLTRRVFFRAMSKLPFGGRIIDRVPFAWRAQTPRADGWERPGHTNFHLGNVGALFAYVHSIGAQKRMWRTPSQFVLTANDDKIDPYACRAFAQRAPNPHPVWWFGPERKVPHAMLSAHENGDTQSLREVHAIVTDFLVRGVSHNNC